MYCSCSSQVYKNGTPTDLLGRTLYLVDTPSGYRYAVKVLSVDGVTFLHDQQRNIETRVAGYIPGINQLLAEGKLYDYYPQLDLPDDHR